MLASSVVGHLGRLLPVALWVASVLPMAAPAFAQLSSGGLAGRVQDPTSAALPGVVVEARDVATGRTHSARSNDAGRFLFASLTPGRYDVAARLDGYRPFELRGVRVATGETLRLDVTLEVGGIQDAVVVIGSASPVANERMGLGQGVSEEQLRLLPLNGRAFIPLVSLAPGVALPPGSSLPRINGGRPRVNEYIFDGISVLQPEPGQVPFFPVIDGIQEFRVDTNSPPAEFGRFNGGVINLTTRSGGDQVSGSVFTFAHHETLNARNAFAPPGGDKPHVRRNQFGGVIGGPVVRGRTFYFEARELAREQILSLQGAIGGLHALAEDVTGGGDAYPVGVRELARRMATELEQYGQTLQAIVRKR